MLRRICSIFLLYEIFLIREEKVVNWWNKDIPQIKSFCSHWPIIYFRGDFFFFFFLYCNWQSVFGSLNCHIFKNIGIGPTWNCTHFLKIGIVVAGGGFYFHYIHRGNKSDKERKIVRKKLSFKHTKRFNTFFKRWVQFRVGTILRLP